MKRLLSLLIATLALSAAAYEVSLDTYAIGEGQELTTRVKLDTAKGLSYVGATLAYDSEVLIVKSVTAGTLASVFTDDFTHTDQEGRLTVTLFAGSETVIAEEIGGTIATIVFTAREGTTGLYSDLAILDVQLGERLGQVDLTMNNPITTKNGFVRIMKSAAELPPVACEDEKLLDEVVARILEIVKTADASRLEGAKEVRVSGPKGDITAIADLGIAPKFAALDADGILRITYARPELKVVGFDPSTGEIAFKVTPGEGNAIVKEPIVDSLRVYATDDLKREMTEIAKTSVDLTPYLRAESTGEGVITVSLDTKRFVTLRVERK